MEATLKRSAKISRSFGVAAPLLVALGFCLPAPCIGQIPILLPEFPVDPTSELADDGTVARDASGRYVRVWNEFEFAPPVWWRASVWARQFDAEGSPLNDGFQVGSWSPWDGSYMISAFSPLVASDPSGNYVV